VNPDLAPEAWIAAIRKRRTEIIFEFSKIIYDYLTILNFYENNKIYQCCGADPGCLSRIPDPDFYPSRISDPKTATE
jgi:hypothetical protein